MSFGVIASTPQGAHIVAKTCTSSGMCLPDRLANLVDISSSRSLSLVRMLVGFYEQLCKGVKEGEEAPMPFGNVHTELVPKLKKLAREAKLHRLRVQAAYLLHLLNKDCDSMVILHIDPTRDIYWFQSEVNMLQLLRKVHNIHAFEFLDSQRPSIRKDQDSAIHLGTSTSHTSTEAQAPVQPGPEEHPEKVSPTENAEAMCSFPDSSSPLPSMQGAIMKEGEVLAEPERVESSSKAFSAKNVEMPSTLLCSSTPNALPSKKDHDPAIWAQAPTQDLDEVSPTSHTLTEAQYPVQPGPAEEHPEKVSPTENAEGTRQSSKNAEAMFSFPDSSSPLPSMQGAIMKEGEVLAEPVERVESSSKAFSAKHVEMLFFKDLKQPTNSDAQSSISQESELPAKSICMTPSSPASVASPIESIDKGENRDGIRLLLRLENTQLGESIFVGAVIHAIPSENLEFYFFNAEDMTVCVGVGLPQAKVIIHNDLSITIEETTVSERELKDTWMPFLSDSSCHLIMKVQMEAPGMQVNGDDHAQTFATEKGETLSQLCGVEFDCVSRYIVDGTYDAAEVSWPLLYEMALFILTTNDVQCNETNGRSSGQGSASFQGNKQDNNMGDKLKGKRDSVCNRGNLQGAGGDGDEDGVGSSGSVLEGDINDEEEELEVTVYPLSICDILNTRVKPYGLDGVSIGAKLVFKFYRKGDFKSIYIRAVTFLQLGSEKEVYSNTNLCGWYHTDINISFGCKAREGDEQSWSVAVLDSCSIVSEKTGCKYTAVNSKTSTGANTVTAGGKLSGKVLGTGLEGSLSDSRMTQKAATAGGNDERPRECICKGFCFTSKSRHPSPGRADFILYYPLQNLSIWDDREFLQSQGLFESIDPSIEGTWIPLNDNNVSPYFFRVERSLKLHKRAARREDSVCVHEQRYNLPFYVNHAMTHLKRHRREALRLHGNGKSVSDVVTMGSVNRSLRDLLGTHSNGVLVPA